MRNKFLRLIWFWKNNDKHVFEAHFDFENDKKNVGLFVYEKFLKKYSFEVRFVFDQWEKHVLMLILF